MLYVTNFVEAKTNNAQHMKIALMQFEDSAFMQADLGLRFLLTESADIVVYVNEQRMSMSDCTDGHLYCLYMA